MREGLVGFGHAMDVVAFLNCPAAQIGGVVEFVGQLFRHPLFRTRAGIGDDPALKMLVQVTTAFAGLTSLALALQGATDNGAGAPAAFSTWWTGPAVALAGLVLGARLYDMDMPRPPAGIAVPRFLQLAYTIVGVGTGGALKAFIVLDRHDQMYNATNNAVLGGYPPGIIIAN